MSRSRARSPSIASDYSDITTSPSEAQAEWDESMRQLELLCSMILLPVFGKWAGRQVAYYIWAKVPSMLPVLLAQQLFDGTPNKLFTMIPEAASRIAQRQRYSIPRGDTIDFFIQWYAYRHSG
ncbi:hypothetical protein G7K_1174-t1 [Saitoella complicata NRRL Y-17804]|uniref:Uncharacterized protein n=1 Tax=Saitoella complicata (strain BCRC 22490 / CBS 7301 / JCM 7358 / NBRC 10748 / NRRL Y-17804) TaxID=698492 RepID=A0A0E9NAQ8_SAICN|nr:hypothetical protein G7K_1174-t1 [Saitoella complicata NRRL Y-17804]